MRNVILMQLSTMIKSISTCTGNVQERFCLCCIYYMVRAVIYATFAVLDCTLKKLQDIYIQEIITENIGLKCHLKYHSQLINQNLDYHNTRQVLVSHCFLYVFQNNFFDFLGLKLAQKHKTNIVYQKFDIIAYWINKWIFFPLKHF